MFNLQAITKHHQRVAAALYMLSPENLSSDATKYFAQSWLETLASKNGNDILEPVLVEATGHVPKSIAIKHGADSEDGLLESKPFKTKYNAHISDDTPSSLLRHHSIPYISLGQASADGRNILWAIYMSYRAFDNSRYKAIMKKYLTVDQRSAFAEVLPSQIEERYETLTKLAEVLGPKKYERSNPLPMQDISALKAGEFTLWINPDVDIALIDKNIVKLNTDFPDSTLSAEYMQPFLQMREYYLKKVQEAKTIEAHAKAAKAAAVKQKTQKKVKPATE